EHLARQHRKRLQRAGLRDDPAASEIEAPEVRLTSARREGKHALLEAEVQARAPLQSYQIYVNGVPTFPGSGKPLHGTAARVSERIELGQGLNTVEITAFDVRGVEAFRARWSSTYAGEGKGDLYFIGFGVARYQNPALNLQFADKDALDLANVMQRYQPHFRKVVVRTYVNEAVTVENIVKAKEVLRDARVDDTVVVFVSGHGAYDLSREPTYYYATHTVDVKDLAGTAASFERIESLLRDIGPRRKLLLVDTCQSGEIVDALRAEIEARRHAMGLDGRTSAALQSDRASWPRRGFLYDRDRYFYNDLNRLTGSLVVSQSPPPTASSTSARTSVGRRRHGAAPVTAGGRLPRDRSTIFPGGEAASLRSVKPVAMTVMRTSSPRAGSITAPKMMLASSWAASCTMRAASSTSCSERSVPPVKLMRTPLAPAMAVSSRRGLATAF